MADALLMNKNTPIIKIDIADNGMIMKATEFLNETLLPLQIGRSRDLETLNKWFKSRRIPDKREGLAAARMQFRGFERDHNYFSLSDQYWVKYNKNESWDKLNFFTNSYSTAVGRIFFEPWTVDAADVKKACPDRTTGGVLKKHWVRDSETSVSHLIKCGSEMYKQEPLSEVLASMMLRQLHLINAVSYDLIVDGLHFCSCCRNFVTPDTEFVPAYAIYSYEKCEEGETVYTHLLRMCDKFVIPKAKLMINRMILADYVIGNPDRHLTNFGFLRNVETGDIIGFAPLFDFGAAYCTTAATSERRKSRFFSDVEQSICKKAAEKGRLRDVRSTQAMRDLVKSYSVISDQKKELVLQMLEQTDHEIDALNQQRSVTDKKKTEEKEIEERMARTS